MALLDNIVKQIAEEVATDLIKRRGTNISDTTIAMDVADVLSDLFDLDSENLINLVRTYLKVADVHVAIPTWRVDDDGQLKTDEQLNSELKGAW